MPTDIRVSYLRGLSKEDFDAVNDLGYDVDIPDSQEPKVMAYMGKPEDYIIIFAIYFSLKVADELANKVAEKLAKNFIKVIKKLWTKHKDTKPCILESGKEPIYKLPKAVISVKISEDEDSKLEITNDLSDKEIEVAAKTYLKLVKLQYKNRKKETELKKRLKK